MNVFPSKIEHNILEYILGGNAYFCIRQRRNGVSDERWYCVRVNDKNPNMYFAHVNDGGKNKYLGYFYKNDIGGLKKFYIKNKSAEAEDELGVPLIRVLNRLKNVGDLWNGVVEVISDGRCSRCGKRITDFESIAYGLGPTCRKKMGL